MNTCRGLNSSIFVRIPIGSGKDGNVAEITTQSIVVSRASRSLMYDSFVSPVIFSERPRVNDSTSNTVHFAIAFSPQILLHRK